jgi:phosphoribosylamine---glycine ligase
VKVLVLGSGGREHALVWRLRRDPDVSEIVAAPGNPGIAAEARCVPLDLSDATDALALVGREAVDLTVVGPEVLLEKGFADAFRERGRPIVGPSRAAAALEWSKVFAKEFMARHGIPTARFVVCDRMEDALQAVAGPDFGFPVVVKADGLAAGKGVVVAANRQEAEGAVRAAMEDGQFGAAGARLVIEECLTGPEVSFFVLSDGEHAVPLSTAEDHKRIWDDDRGPNTGGMGAFAPSARMTPELASTVMTRIVNPVLRGMRAEGHPYRGFLYVGLMITPRGPEVIEFNVRFGDPEAQVVLPQIEGPFARALLGAATDQLAGVEGLTLSRDRFVGVVLAAGGYPSNPESGRPIAGLDGAAAVPNAIVFHAGTRLVDGRVVTSGGRVLTVVGRGPSYIEAMATAYAAVGFVSFDGMQFRRDIGRKAVVGSVEV